MARRLLGDAPFLDYYHMLLAPNSTSDTTWANIDEFRFAVEYVVQKL